MKRQGDGLSSVLRGAFLIGAVAFQAGCGEASADGGDSSGTDGPLLVPGCEAESIAACDVAEEECQRRLYALMRCTRGMSGEGSVPPIDFVTSDELGDVVDPDDESTTEPALDVALGMLGLLSDGDSWNDVAGEKRREFAGAVYLRETKRIVFARKDEPGAWESVLLAHELVHALQDEEHDLATFWDEHVSSTESALAVRSVIEGEAAALEMKVAPYLLGFEPSDELYGAYVDEAIGRGEGTLSEENRFVGAVLEFPYTFGLRSAWLSYEDGGADALHERFDSVPSTLEVWQASPVTGAIASDFPAIAAPQSYSAVEDDVLGAWALRAVLEDRASDGDADDLAGAWRGDRFQVFAADSDASLAAVAYAIEWADEARAERATAVLLTLASPERLEIVRHGTRTTLYVASDTGVVSGWLPP